MKRSAALLLILGLATATLLPAQELAPAATSPLVEAARARIGVTTSYDPAYVALPYPGGDVPDDRGVCTDVVVRAFRKVGVDLQKAVHEDMKENFSKYPQRWGLKRPDRNIDHRRVPNLQAYFKRRGWERPITDKAADYLPGDVVAWDLTGRGLVHVGLVSDRKSSGGDPLILHNIGSGTEESDALFRFAIIGHYRPRLPEINPATATGR